MVGKKDLESEVGTTSGKDEGGISRQNWMEASGLWLRSN